ncbi:ATP-binding protein [Lentzea aerocolonigenes]|uniref:ATP-binding protein n=1 Tax=Lentzea aerocolonigenes TaxID=68170 RepID=UPI0009DF0E77|nr:ATP-binding protein [Lentzea aerocolonigenes]MCP2249077.1 Histidine kinase-, DNA gyrase B-, and HSP90-like ATPase [Lentzea aerocolonigenes]
MPHKLLDITPTPQVLIALTRTPITPIDAISELIDNAVDSFHAAEVQGIRSPVRHVVIEVPGLSEVSRGQGLIRVRDTGAGLTDEQIGQAMQAGYSTKNPFDTLGLFGMGFNIATGKLGRITRVISARPEDEKAVEVLLDLPQLVKTGKFEVNSELIDKPQGFEHGTIVEVRGWWPTGDQNAGFIREVAKMPKHALRERIGRRYATLIRGDSQHAVKITVNNTPCQPFEHCTWSAERFVQRSGHGTIPARITIDEELGSSRRCTHDGTDFNGNETCPRCGGTESRQLSQRVHGWVGIQRFDDKDKFGIDLIRNGRAIREAEKDAFFEHVDETTGNREREYPTDQQYGRIVGEIHLDHVPVDFQKQNFQQATDEWQSAMQYLRGDSLLPSKWTDDNPNESPVSKLFQGYRKVRNFGLPDMYMGRYDTVKKKAVRIPRETEADYYQKFINKEDGYFDDSKWWELVESATEAPIEALPECPDCSFQNVNDAESCTGCGKILIGKPCYSADCKEKVPKSADTCPKCGADQTPELLFPWRCNFCEKENKADSDHCNTCGSLSGAPHPASPEVLRLESELRDELGARGLSIILSNGVKTNPVDIFVHAVHRPIAVAHQRPSVPLVTDKKSGSITIFADLNHDVFVSNGIRPEYLIASEAAQYIYDLHSKLHGKPGHTVAVLTSDLLIQGWGESVVDNPDTVRDDIKGLFADITERVLDIPHAADFYSELDEAQQRSMANEMIRANVDLEEIGRLKSGAYLKYCNRDALAAFFGRYPIAWFGGKVWTDHWPEDGPLGSVVSAKLQEELKIKYLRCMEDCASYLRYEQPEQLLVVRARAAAEFLTNKLSS